MLSLVGWWVSKQETGISMRTVALPLVIIYSSALANYNAIVFLLHWGNLTRHPRNAGWDSPYHKWKPWITVCRGCANRGNVCCKTMVQNGEGWRCCWSGTWGGSHSEWITGTRASWCWETQESRGQVLDLRRWVMPIKASKLAVRLLKVQMAKVTKEVYEIMCVIWDFSLIFNGGLWKCRITERLKDFLDVANMANTNNVRWKLTSICCRLFHKALLDLGRVAGAWFHSPVDGGVTMLY